MIGHLANAELGHEPKYHGGVERRVISLMSSAVYVLGSIL